MEMRVAGRWILLIVSFTISEMQVIEFWCNNEEVSEGCASS